MNLDDIQAFARTDISNMLAEIDGLPDQLQAAWDRGLQLPLPDWQGLQGVVVAGMGGSAIGADLLAAYGVARCPLPFVVHRNYGLPAWAHGPATLVIASSHSGNTEETLDAFETALARGCRVLAVSTGGQLAQRASQAAADRWTFTHHGQPRAAVGYSFGLLLAVLARLGLLPDPAADLDEAVSALRAQQESLSSASPVSQNPAKRLAGQLVNRWVAVFGADLLEPVARRWKGQLSEIAKAWAQFEFLPEADHNTLAGVVNPGAHLPQQMVLFLRAPSSHERNRLRADLTKKILMLEGLSTDFVDASGASPLAHQWTLLHFGDYVAYYLAMAYGVDPTPVEAIEAFKAEMRAASGRSAR